MKLNMKAAPQAESEKMKLGSSGRPFQKFGDHDELMGRLKKTLYYGKLPKTECLSMPLTEIAVELFSRTGMTDTLDRLDIGHAAHVSCEACVSPCSLMLALLYLDRLKTHNPNYLQKVSQTELFLVSLMIASKFMYDDGEEDEVFNNEWASSAGMDVKDVNHLEREFLTAIDWSVFVDKKTFMEMLAWIEGHIAWQEATRRGWFSYTDLAVLMDTLNPQACWNLLSENVFKVSVGCLASYAASFLTLLGSVFIVAQAPVNQHSFKDSTSVVNSSCGQSSEHENEASHLASGIPTSNRTASPVDVLTTGMILASLSTGAELEDDTVTSEEDEVQHPQSVDCLSHEEVTNKSSVDWTRQTYYDTFVLSWLYGVPGDNNMMLLSFNLNTMMSATWTNSGWLAVWSIIQFTGGGDVKELEESVNVGTFIEQASLPSECFGVNCSVFGEKSTSVLEDDDHRLHQCRPVVKTVTWQL